ncbi:transposase [Klebsiella pneumoniae]|nr:transposase [Klebsiella pneumoniae]
MKKTRYTEEQIAFALKQAETGTATGSLPKDGHFLKPLFITGRRNSPVWRDRTAASAATGG